MLKPQVKTLIPVPHKDEDGREYRITGILNQEE
jgi:hypothetical protein